MDRDLQEYYESLLELFSTSGWKQFLEDIGDNLEILGDITTIPDEKQFWFRRGQVEAIQRVLAYEESILAGYEEAKQ
jgi:hypothetical protein